ncbi:hypothetical protein [Streptomyces sp. NPDC059009]|uniref:hypothetical protein n=1 Tax=Streptomyces sp. NPDC059009 TaxID=3346694 RepID=UPI0036D13403
MATTTKRRTGARQLLLLAALLFGIVTMHTLGHPTGHGSGSGGSEAPAMTHAQGMAGENVAGQAMTGQGMTGQAMTGQAMTGQAMTAREELPPHATSGAKAKPRAEAKPRVETKPLAEAVPRTVANPVPAQHDGMDPLSVCLAVLGGLTLVLLLAAAVSRPWSGAGLVRPRGWLPAALRPRPPPPRILLAHLSVLRI